MIRELGEVDGALIEVRLLVDEWSGGTSAAARARLVNVVHAVAGRALTAHRESIPTPEAPPPRWEEPSEVIVRETPWGVVRRETYENGYVVTAEGETTIVAGPDAGEVVRERIVMFSSGQDPRQRLDLPPLPPGTVEKWDEPVAKPDGSVPSEAWGSPFNAPAPVAFNGPDPELDEARRWAAYAEPAVIDPVERLRRDRERQAVEAEEAERAREAEKARVARAEAHKVAQWLAGRALGEIEGKPGLPGPEPTRSVR